MGSPLLPPRRLLVCGLRGWDEGWGEAGGKECGERVGPRGPWWALRVVEAAEHGHCHPQGRPCLRHPISAGRACSPVPQARDSRSPGKDCEKPAGKLRLDGGSAVQPSAARACETRLVGDRPSAVSSQQAPPPGDRPGSGRCAGEASTCCHMSLALTPTLRSGVTSPVPRGGSRAPGLDLQRAEGRALGCACTPRLTTNPGTPTPPASPRVRAHSQALLLRSEGVGRWPGGQTESSLEGLLRGAFAHIFTRTCAQTRPRTGPGTHHPTRPDSVATAGLQSKHLSPRCRGGGS